MDKKSITKSQNYTGLGLIELIISIGVAAIAISVLMTMVANSMSESVRLERQDALTRLAMDGALVVRKHAENVNNPEIPWEFGQMGDLCYRINIEGSEVDFNNYISDQVNKENADVIFSTRADFHEDIIYDYAVGNLMSDVYYIAYCVDRIEVSSLNVSTYVGRVITGYVECRNCNILPYEHNIVVNIRQS